MESLAHRQNRLAHHLGVIHHIKRRKQHRLRLSVLTQLFQVRLHHPQHILPVLGDPPRQNLAHDRRAIAGVDDIRQRLDRSVQEFVHLLVGGVGGEVEVDGLEPFEQEFVEDGLREGFFLGGVEAKHGRLSIASVTHRCGTHTSLIVSCN